jgi:C-terminal processing protease CtpA/Prc
MLAVIVIHSALLSYRFQVVKDHKPKGNPPSTPQKIRIIARVEQEHPALNNPDNGFNSKETPCKSWYYGVGITHDILTGEVREVPKGYPAYKAGILPGDTLLDVLDHMGVSTMGTPNYRTKSYDGKPVTVVIMRGGRELSFHLRREKVCTDE